MSDMVAGPARVEGVLFGREPELELLDALLALASAGEAQTVLISGLVGVGKTSLARRAAEQRTEATVLFGACLPLVSIAVPLLALRSLVRSAPPEFEAPDIGSPAVDALALVAIDDWVTRLCADRSVILVVDDLQWADQATLDVLTFLIAGPVGRRLAIVATVRTEEIGGTHLLQRWLADIRRLPRVVEIEPGPLDHEATARQVAALLGQVPHTTLVDDVHAHSGGNPYLNRLIVQGLPPTARRIDPELPRDLRTAVLGAWGRMSWPAREATTALAVAGVPMSASDLARVTTDEESRAGSALMEASDAGIVERRSSGDFWFRHPLTPEVLEEALPTQRRESLHAAFAAFLEARGPNEDVSALTAVADHWSRSGSPTAALRSALIAADVAERKGAWRDAVRMLGRATELLASDDERLVPTLRRGCRAGREAGVQREELDGVENLIAMLEDDPAADPEELSELMVRRSHLRASAGLAFFEVDAARRAVEIAERAAGTGAHAFALAELAHCGAWHEDPAAAQHAAQALEVARAVHDDRALSYALTANAMLAVYAGDGEKGIAFAAAGAEAALRARDWWGLCHAALWEANAADIWSAEAFAERLSVHNGVMRSHGAPHPYIAWIGVNEAMAWLASGNWETCAARLREAATSDPGPFVDVQVRLLAARLATWQGRQDEAEQHMQRADEVIGTSTYFLAFPVESIRAEVLLGRGDPLGAYRAVERRIIGAGVPPTMCEWLLPLAARAIADRVAESRDVGNDVDALCGELATLVAAHPDIIRDFGGAVPLWDEQVAALAAMYAAEVARGLAASDQSERWIIAADAFATGRLPWEEAYARRRAAEALLVQDGDRVRGADQLRRGLKLADRLGAAPIASDLRALARRARIALAKPTRIDGDKLAAVVQVTPRERDILSLVVAGRTYGEIARELFISEKTVSTHISHLLDKTRTANRLELAGFVERTLGGNGGA
jgi:DNA-binding CsgD family transcriptional regulator